MFIYIGNIGKTVFTPVMKTNVMISWYNVKLDVGRMIKDSPKPGHIMFPFLEKL